jgi:hypothetical protein
VSETVTEALAVKPTYEEIVSKIRHPGVQEILRTATENEQHLDRELAYLEANQELTLEAKAVRADELIERYSPKISEAYRSAREKVEAAAETQYLFSLPFPEGKTFAQVKVSDTTEMLAIQGEAEAIAQRIAGKSLQEITRERSKNPRDKGMQQRTNPALDALRREFDMAMAAGGVEGRIRALAIRRVCESSGISLDDVVGHHRTDTHFRALEDARHFERAAFTLPSGRQAPHNPFSAKRRGPAAVGTYSSGNRVMRGGMAQQVFTKKRKPAWK